MLHPKTIPIQSQEARVKAISRVCSVIAVCAVLDVLIYSYLALYLLAITLIFVAIFFGVLFVLNQKGYYKVSRTALIVVTNVGVLIFSAYLGFKTGIYLYLFAAPLLTYMLFDFKQKIEVFICFFSYVATFITAFIIDKENVFTAVITNEKTIIFLYSVNMIFSFILCFVLIIYFSYNNSNYVSLLIDSSKSIIEQQDQLKHEILEKNKTYEQLNETLKDKELLLSEIHHRVKNNLAVISGLIELQNYYVNDSLASSILLDSKNRVKTIALLHEKLYGNKSYERIDANSYITELVSFIKESYTKPDQEVLLHLNIENIEISIEEGLPFSLLLSELITNSYKHAFKSKISGNIQINLTKKGVVFSLEYIDDGVGFELSKKSKDKSLGLNLLEAFSTQLKSIGIITTSEGKGFNYKINFVPKA